MFNYNVFKLVSASLLYFFIPMVSFATSSPTAEPISQTELPDIIQNTLNTVLHRNEVNDRGFFISPYSFIIYLGNINHPLKYNSAGDHYSFISKDMQTKGETKQLYQSYHPLNILFYETTQIYTGYKNQFIAPQDNIETIYLISFHSREMAIKVTNLDIKDQTRIDLNQLSHPILEHVRSEFHKGIAVNSQGQIIGFISADNTNFQLQLVTKELQDFIRKHSLSAPQRSLTSPITSEKSHEKQNSKQGFISQFLNTCVSKFRKK